MIQDIGLQIKDTEGSIEKTSLKIEESKERLSVILRTIYEEDKKSLIEIFLTEENMSDFFENLIALQTLNDKSTELLADIKNLKLNLEGQKQDLDEEKMDLERIVKVRLLQRQESSELQLEQENYLKLTEEQYQKQLEEKSETEKRVSEIRARIFELIGVPKAPTFGEAYEIAKYVTSVTGVRPALLLAVLTQESNIGKNVGQCYITDTSTGKGIRITSGKIEVRTMNPTRDLPYFIQICEKLGRDPLSTPVSCPMSIGWGGAMGPAQFIPDTWGNPKYGYGQKVKAITGKEADPWDIRDAFLAAGVYLKDLGAQTNEFKAVMRYFSGYSWSKWEEFYGRSVLAIAAQYEEDINELER
jgi:membrane-bound lytic murein transglycosylase B